MSAMDLPLHHQIPWFQRDPRRLLREIDAMHSSRFGCELIRLDGRPCWRGIIEVEGDSHHLFIDYPFDYPLRQPMITEVDRKRRKIRDDSLTSHQLASQVLCLFTMGHGQDSWSDEYTAVTALERFTVFRTRANQRKHVPSTHSEDEPVSVHSNPHALYLHPDLIELMKRPGAFGHFSALTQADIHTTIVQMMSDHCTQTQRQIDLEGWDVIPFQSTLQGQWFHFRPRRQRWEEALRTPHSLRHALHDCLGKTAARLYCPDEPVLILKESNHESAQVISVWPEHHTSGTRMLQLLKCEPVEVATMESALFHRVDGTLSGRGLLANALIVMVGLGSLGSHIALALARTGVSNFLLVDPDILRVENVCRHVGDLHDVGMLKVEVVANKIKAINPLANVVKVSSSVLPDMSVGASEAQPTIQLALQDPRTLFIVTVADDRVERPLNRLLVGHGRIGIFASVLGNADHGRVFRVIPGKSACYQCVLHAQAISPDAFPHYSGTEGNPEPGVGGYHQPGIPGIGIDVQQVALLTARFGLQTLSMLLGNELGYPPATEDHFLWTNRGGWCFDRPLQVISQPIPRVEGCSACDPTMVPGELAPHERSRLSAILQIAPNLRTP